MLAHVTYANLFVGEFVHPPTPQNLLVTDWEDVLCPPPVTLAIEILLPADSLLIERCYTSSHIRAQRQAEGKTFWQSWRRAGQSDIERQLPYK